MAWNSIGTFQVKREDEILNVEWQIDNFLSLPGTTGSFYDSPAFTFSDSFWHLKIFPYEKEDEEDWIRLYLARDELSSKEAVTYKSGIKKSDGTLRLKENVTWKFDRNREYGEMIFLGRSELLQRENEWLSSGALTVVCSLKKPYPPQESNRLCTGLKDKLASKKFSDVTIHVQEGVFEAHKVILAASSKVFSAMFEREMSEKSSGTVNIEDCDGESFKDFLNFLYIGRADITPFNVSHLYETAHKYEVEELMSHCVAFMMDHISEDNVCEVAAFAVKYSESDLCHRCHDIFQDKLGSILPTSEWKLFAEKYPVVADKLLNTKVPKMSLEQ